MLRDELGIYAKSLSPANGAIIGDSIDHIEEGYPLGGHQRPTKLVVIVRESFVQSTSVNFVLQADDASGFGTKRDIVTSGVIAKADLVKGAKFEYPIPASAARYTRVVPAVVGTAETTGKVDVFLAQ